MSLKRPTSNESLPATKQLRVAVVSSDGSTSELSEIVDSEASETNSDDSDETVLRFVNTGMHYMWFK
jgi:hypothetical protein